MKAIIGGTGIDRDSRFYEDAVSDVNRYGEVIYTIKDDIVYFYGAHFCITLSKT